MTSLPVPSNDVTSCAGPPEPPPPCRRAVGAASHDHGEHPGTGGPAQVGGVSEKGGRGRGESSQSGGCVSGRGKWEWSLKGANDKAEGAGSGRGRVNEEAWPVMGVWSGCGANEEAVCEGAEPRRGGGQSGGMAEEGVGSMRRRGLRWGWGQ